MKKGSADGEQRGAQGDSVLHFQLLQAFGLFFLIMFVITPLIVNVLLCICLKRSGTQQTGKCLLFCKSKQKEQTKSK